MAEGGGLLNRYRIKSSIGGSNPPLSASSSQQLSTIRDVNNPQQPLGIVVRAAEHVGCEVPGTPPMGMSWGKRFRMWGTWGIDVSYVFFF